jgi:mitochondrial intermediate peptidase
MVGRISSRLLGKSPFRPEKLTGLFGVPGLTRPKDFLPLAQKVTKESRAVMINWRDTQSDSASKSVRTLDGVSNTLCRVADAAELCRNVHKDSTWVDAATQAVQEIAGFMNDVNVDTKFYERLKVTEESFSDASEEEKKIIHAMRVAMETEGVHLSPVIKKELIELQERDINLSFEIVQKKQQSQKGVWIKINPTEHEQLNFLFSQLPKRNLGKEVFIPADHPAASEILRFSSDSEIRRQIWKIDMSPLSETDPEEYKLIDELVGIRTRLANLRGYDNWTGYAQRESVLSGPESVAKFLSNLWLAIRPGLIKEFETLEKERNDGGEIQPWDLTYLVAKYKSRVHGETSHERQDQHHSVAVNQLLNAAEKLCESKLGVKLRLSPNSVECWDSDVLRYEIVKDETVIAILYMDLYGKDFKAVQSAQFTIASSKLFDDGTKQLPRTAMVLSLPAKSNVDTFSSAYAVTFFHELGHVLHSLLSETELQHFSGARGTVDYVEFPSHLFEYYVTDKSTCKELFGHALTRQHSFVFMETAQQLIFALMDQVYYKTGSPRELAKHLPSTPEQGRWTNERLVHLLSPPSPVNFDHLVHYGGSYYCYLLCKTVAADIWKRGFSGKNLYSYLARGSVDQSLDAIYSLVDEKAPKEIPLDAWLQEINKN